MAGRTFQLSEGIGAVEFSEEVLQHMYSFAQRGLFSREAGGQLFSQNPHHQIVQVTHVSGPNSGDRRTRHQLNWDEAQANEDRESHFQSDRHPVGLWHTHPESLPKPSWQDEKSTKKYLDALGNEMKGFLLVIIGNKGVTPAMSVWLARTGTSKCWIELQEMKAS